MANKLDPEQARLVRLRDKQIAARDPLVKKRQFNRLAAERERKRDKSLSLAEFWHAIPQPVRSGLWGLLLGLGLLKIVTSLWLAPLALPVMALVTVVLTALGALIGNAIALRDNIKRHL
jgi:hypothetical protein